MNLCQKENKGYLLSVNSPERENASGWLPVAYNTLFYQIINGNAP